MLIHTEHGNDGTSTIFPDFRERDKCCKPLMMELWEHQSRAAGGIFETRPQALR